MDWLEAGTPLILAEGLRAVSALRREFPEHPIVADLKTMDGGYLEAEMMAKAGATHVVVMGRAHPATIKLVVKAGRDFDIQVMGDDLGCEDAVAEVLPGAYQRRVALERLAKVVDSTFQIIAISGEQAADVRDARVGGSSVLDQ